MFRIFTDTKSDIDATSILEMLSTYGLNAELSFTHNEKESSTINILTNNFIQRNDFDLNSFSDVPLFINAYTKGSLKKIGIKAVQATNIKTLIYQGQEYYPQFFLQKPEYLFTADEDLVNCDRLSVVGIQNGVGLSTIPFGQFLILRNGWISRKRKLGRLYPSFRRLPLADGAKKIFLPAYNLIRKKDRKQIATNGFDLNLLLRESLVTAFESIIEKRLRPEKKRLPALITHDVDRPESVEGINALQQIEETYNILSSWYITKSALDNFKEIRSIDKNCFSHYESHDGELAYSNFNSLYESLKKYELNKGFRAPWSHYTIDLFKALDKAGYAHDSSMPSFEAFTPFYNPGGCLDIVPFKPVLPDFKKCNFLEIPITLTVDYGLFVVQKLGAEEAMEVQKQRTDHIIKHEGIVNIVTHPDKKDSGSSKGLRFYDQLLEYINSKKEIEIMDVHTLINQSNSD